MDSYFYTGNLKKQKGNLETENYYLYHLYCNSHYVKRTALENKTGKTHPD